jgi:hypothetical protein
MLELLVIKRNKRLTMNQNGDRIYLTMTKKLNKKGETTL